MKSAVKCCEVRCNTRIMNYEIDITYDTDIDLDVSTIFNLDAYVS